MIGTSLPEYTTISAKKFFEKFLLASPPFLVSTTDGILDERNAQVQDGLLQSAPGLIDLV